MEQSVDSFSHWWARLLPLLSFKAHVGSLRDHAANGQIYKCVTTWLSPTPSQRPTLREKEKLPGWLCCSLQGHLLHPYLVVSAGLTGATEQKRWHLVSTNEKWQMHKSFRLCRVEISVWHSLGPFWCSADENFQGSPLEGSGHRRCAKIAGAVVQAWNWHHHKQHVWWNW